MNNRTTAIEVERLYREAELFHVKLDGLKENTQCASRVNYNGSDIALISDEDVEALKALCSASLKRRLAEVNADLAAKGFAAYSPADRPMTAYGRASISAIGGLLS